MPVAEVHASTIVEIEGGLATAWFGGTKEKARDVVIWMSRNTGNGWSKPIVVADGVNPQDPNTAGLLEPGVVQAIHRLADSLLQGRTLAHQMVGA